MKLGTDVSIAECRRSGYLVMEYKQRDLFPRGVMNKDCGVTFSQSNPEAWNDAGKPDISSDAPLWALSPYDTEWSWNDLIDLVDTPRRLRTLREVCDVSRALLEIPAPLPRELLLLAGVVNDCFGLVQVM